MFEPTARLGRTAILSRGDEACPQLNLVAVPAQSRRQNHAPTERFVAGSRRRPPHQNRRLPHCNTGVRSIQSADITEALCDTHQFSVNLPLRSDGSPWDISCPGFGSHWVCVRQARGPLHVPAVPPGMHGTPFSKIPDIFKNPGNYRTAFSKIPEIVDVELASLEFATMMTSSSCNFSIRDIPKLVKCGKNLFHCK